jgi:hypothetical protein
MRLLAVWISKGIAAILALRPISALVRHWRRSAVDSYLIGSGLELDCGHDELLERVPEGLARLGGHEAELGPHSVGKCKGILEGDGLPQMEVVPNVDDT